MAIILETQQSRKHRFSIEKYCLKDENLLSDHIQIVIKDDRTSHMG